jgi:adenylate cyclase
MSDEVDFAAEGLLDGLEGQARDDRRDLLERLHRDGVPLEELRRAVAEDRLVLLPVERLLSGDARYTGREIAEKTGLPFEVQAAQRQALGMPRPDPDARIFTEEDLHAAERAQIVRRAGISDDASLEFLRVVGEAAARIAEATRTVIGAAYLKPGTSETDAALRFAEAERDLGPAQGELLAYALSLHLREQLRSETVTQAELASGYLPDSEEITVCFADLVGFTRLGEELDPGELGAVAGRLAQMAGDVVKPPVRLVKTIGDAAMLVSQENEAVLGAALDLVEAAEAAGDELPALRAGLARGPALNRTGDWYGRPVNLASRITSVARPASVLADDEVHARAEDGFRWSRAGRRRLKGIREPVALWRARRPEPEPPDSAR